MKRYAGGSLGTLGVRAVLIPELLPSGGLDRVDIGGDAGWREIIFAHSEYRFSPTSYRASGCSPRPGTVAKFDRVREKFILILHEDSVPFRSSR